MNVIILNTSEYGIAPNRLHKALVNAGISAKMLVRDKVSDDPNVTSINTSWIKKKLNFLRFTWERLVILLNNGFNRERLFQVSIANTGTDISEHPLVKEADILHIHWINQGFFSLQDIEKLTRLGKPIVWTMHDMWLCTGICHHAWGCEGFTATCGDCFFLQSKNKKDLSYRVLKRKGFLSHSAIRVVTVSSWLRDMVKKSAVTNGLKVSVIPNVLNASIFIPSDKKLMRAKHSLPENKKLIVIGATKLNDPVKGFEYLRQALSILAKKRDDLFLIMFGDIKNAPSFLSDMPVEYRSMGLMSDPSLIAQLYTAADVTVVSSMYETFGQTLIESMACGCPGVSFNNSGQTDIIEHKVNGYLAAYKDAEDLAAGIVWVLDNTERLHLPEACIEKVQTNYTESVVAEKYISLYKELLTKQ